MTRVTFATFVTLVTLATFVTFVTLVTLVTFVTLVSFVTLAVSLVTLAKKIKIHKTTTSPGTTTGTDIAGEGTTKTRTQCEKQTRHPMKSLMGPTATVDRRATMSSGATRAED